MIPRIRVLLAFGILACAAFPASGQQFLPKAILFNGAPEYSNQELMAAAGLKQGVVLTYAEMNDHAKRLMDTGLFASLAFRFDGQDLIYQLTPSTQLYSVRLENLPVTPGKALDAKLHALFPLYHGEVPSDGGLTEQVRGALEGILATEGIKATVTATPYTDLKLRKVTAISFAVTAPPVVVGKIQLNGPSPALDPKIAEILTSLTGTPYSLDGSPDQIATNLGNYFRDQGYLEAEVHATAGSVPVIQPDAVHVPFVVSILPGALYKLTAIKLAPDLLVTQEEFDKQSHIHPGDIATAQFVRENWQYIERQYHNHGYMKAVIHPAPTFDRVNSAASYTVTVDPGPVYTMGTLRIDNVSDDLRTAMLAAWKIPAGAAFNEGAILGYFATHGVNPKLERVFAAVNCRYTLQLNDDTHTVDVVLKLERRP